MLHHVKGVSVIDSRSGEVLGLHSQLNSPRHQQLGDFHAKSLRHVLTADVGDALESKRDVHWVPAGQVILDTLNYQLNQLRVAGYQY